MPGKHSDWLPAKKSVRFRRDLSRHYASLGEPWTPGRGPPVAAGAGANSRFCLLILSFDKMKFLQGPPFPRWDPFRRMPGSLPLPPLLRADIRVVVVDPGVGDQLAPGPLGDLVDRHFGCGVHFLHFRR